MTLHFLMKNSFYQEPTAALIKWANPGLFLFIFILFKHKFTNKTLGFSRIRSRIVGYEGEHDDHLTTTTAHQLLSLV